MANLTFNDDFNNLSLWNGSSGTWSTTTAFVDPMGNGSSLPSNGEQEWYINSNYGPTSSVKPWTVNNGILTLTAQKVDPSIQQYLGYNQSGLPAMGSYQYTSGLIETNHSFNQTYGYFEMKAQLPAGQGLWPAFWLMPSNGAWPPELDVMEALGKDTTTAYASVHTAQTGTHTSQGMAVNVGDFSSGYHTYAVDWESDKITFFYDNKQVYQVATPADMHGPMYMIANLAMGGGWAGSVDSTTPFPAHMNIDYIRAWDANPYTTGGATVPSTPTTPSAPSTPSTPTAPTGTTGAIVATVQGGQTLVGTSGADVFQFNKLPWSPDHITGFQVGVDKLDLHAIFPNYTGSDPIRDGYVTLTDDGHGGTNVLVNPDGHATAANPWPTYVVDLDGVSKTGLTSSSLFGGASATTPSTPSTPSVPSTPSAPSAGGAIVATVQGGQTLVGTSGADVFQFNKLPWTPDHITGFQVGVDKLDLHSIFPSYTGSDPIRDGYVTLSDDGHGGTNVLVNPDGHATAANPWPTYVVDLDGVSKASLTSSNLFGVASSTSPTTPTTPTTPATGAGVTLNGTGHDTLLGGAGNDTLVAATPGSETLTGGGGADIFRFGKMPWTPDHITDFQVGVDKLDLHALYPGYTGTNPVAAGYVSLADDGHGGTNVLVNPDGHATAANPWPTYVVDLDHVSPSSLSGSNWLV